MAVDGPIGWLGKTGGEELRAEPEDEQARRGHLRWTPAAAELRGFFELFQDDDVLEMFDMRAPSDAAASRFTFKAQQMGIPDQTVEHWFDPFGWTAPTGYLRGNTERPAPDDR